jgi:gliding motility-associated-like protein
MSKRKIIIFFLLIFSSISCFSATFVVTSNADSGPGTLRDAITQATTNSGGTINFNLPATVAGRTITLLSALPSLPSNLTIDGSSQTGASFGVSSAHVALFYQVPVEELFSGLSIINQSNVVIKGLYMNNTTYVGNASMQYFWRGIKIEGGNNISIINSVITGFYFPVSSNWESDLVTNGLIMQQDILGVDVDGQTLPPNSELFAVLENLDGNIILGAKGIGNYFATGLSVSGNNTVSATNRSSISITGNYIGVNYAINTVSESFGLSVQNISTSNTIYIQDNVIDNLLGVASIYLNALSQTINVVGNYIGIDKTLTKNLTTSLRGIYVDGCPLGQTNIGDYVTGDANYIANCKPVEVNNSKVAISRNSFFCTLHAYPIHDEADPKVPVANILNSNTSSVSGTATPNSTVELFYSDKCSTCSPQNYFTSITAGANGTWACNQPITGGVIASATLNGNTSEFTSTRIDSTNVKVNNACSNGLGSITGMLPNTAINVQWVDKNGVPVGNTADLQNVKPGIYRLTVGNGSCESSSAYYQIKNIFEADISNVLSTNTTCGNNNGAISGITIKNNDPGQTNFAWNDASGKLWGSSQDLKNVPAGSYNLSVSSAGNTCTDVLGPFVVKNTDGIIINETGAQAQKTPCNKSAGSITGIEIKGGTGNYSYIWWNAEQQTVGTQKDLTGQPAGTYKLQVTDGSQCGPVYSSFIQIPEINGITLDETGAISNPATCEMSNGSITGIQVAGATTYTWTDATGKTYITPTPDLTKAAAGSYTLTASNTNGCTITSQPHTITQPAPTQFPGYVVTQAEPCFGQSDGMLTVNADALVKSERWVTPQNVSLSGASINDLIPGTYQLFLTDQNGCESLYGTYSLTTLTQLVIADQGNIVNSTCGMSDGSITGLLITGGLPPYNYSWTDLNGTPIGTDSSGIVKIPNGNYNVLITDAHCGQVNTTYTVLDNTIDLPTPLVSNVQSCSSGNILIKVNDPVASAVYRLYNSPTSAAPVDEQTGGQFKVTVNQNTIYYISEVNGSCESARAEVKVTVGLSVLNIANTFTPNGDGHNDYWQINNIENYPSAFVQVFNRYGQKVYESKGYGKPFDGSYNGRALPSGAYYYIINLSSNCSLLAGSVTIIR